MMRSLANGISRERKNCQNMDAANSKLTNGIGRTKSSALRLASGLEKERRARRELEAMRDDLDRQLEGSRAEITALRDLHTRIQEAVGKERKAMHMAEALKEDHAQEKLVDARLILEAKYQQVNALIADVETFLRPTITKENEDTRASVHQQSGRWR